MSAGNAYVFQSQISQIMSAQSNVSEISQQSADQLLYSMPFLLILNGFGCDFCERIT